AQPAFVLAIAATGTVESSLKRHRDMIGKEVLRPGAKRNPLVPFILWIAALRTLVDEHRLNGKLIVWLQQEVLGDSKLLCVFEKRSWVINRRAEIAGGSLSVLD